jgi:hypothetical protein
MSDNPSEDESKIFQETIEALTSNCAKKVYPFLAKRHAPEEE